MPSLSGRLRVPKIYPFVESHVSKTAKRGSGTAAHPCKERKDGAPAAGLCQHKAGPPVRDRDRILVDGAKRVWAGVFPTVKMRSPQKGPAQAELERATLGSGEV